MSYFNTQERQAFFLYLFMHVDGVLTSEEKERFNQLCHELKIDNDFKTKLYEIGEKLRFADRNDNSDMVISLMNSLMNGERTFKTEIMGNKTVEIELPTPFSTCFLKPKSYFNKAEQAFMIWSMVNLGYADTAYSKTEQKIVGHLVSVWEMDKTIYNQIITFAETLVALESQREWILSTNKSNEEKNIILKQCDSDIQKISKNVERMIEEIYI